MKRFLAPALILSSFAIVGMAGCEDTSTAKKTTEITTPDGSTKVEEKIKVEQSGSNPPVAPVESPK